MINNLFFEYFWIIKRAIPFKIAPKKIFCIVWFEMLHPYFTGLPILINKILWQKFRTHIVSILILLDTLLLPYFQKNPLFICATEIFSDIKIEILGVIFIIFCYFFSIFRNSKYVFLLVLRGFFSTFLFPGVVGIFSTNLFYHTFLIFQSFF